MTRQEINTHVVNLAEIKALNIIRNNSGSLDITKILHLK